MTRLKINLNGDAKSTLVNDRFEVIKAIDTVLEKLVKIKPHGRNYQTNSDPRDFDLDVADHIARIRTLSNLRDSIEGEAMWINNMGEPVKA